MSTDLTHARWSPRLSEFLDGTLSMAEAEACAAHLDHCEACHADLAALTSVVRTLRQHAADAPPVPSAAVWQSIASQVEPRPAMQLQWQRWTPWLAAAAIALTAVGLLRQPAPARAPSTSVPIATPTTLTVATARARPTYDVSVADLRRLLEEDRARLSPKTRKAISTSLATIDSAIAEAERAVAADSTDVYVSSHLARIRARKLALLREAARLVQS